ncbi:Mitochondrial GTP/GDP carrier protein 1 [Dissophora ornata]|nr:Mitochondrial GTP/GDP carrier protein 1 [Dissophora ornata]
MKKYASLFPGLGFAAGYKIMQRVYKFGGQPFVNEYLNRNFKGSFNNVFGEKTGKTMMHATAGSFVGIGEIALLPLDVLKIKRQTNPEAFRGRGVMKIVAEERMGLYRGALWTAGRNAPGSFALFGGSAFVKEWVFGLEDYSKATFFQNFCASIGGSIASITVAAPLDVVKTRIQNRNFDNPEGGVSIIKNMIRNEGFGSFFKGLLPKILVVGPKLVFSFTIAQQLIPLFHNKFEEAGLTHIGNTAKSQV